VQSDRSSNSDKENGQVKHFTPHHALGNIYTHTHIHIENNGD